MATVKRVNRLVTLAVLVLLVPLSSAPAQDASWQPASQPVAAESTPPAGQPASVPTSRPRAADPQRLNDYVALIEGPNLPLAARRTGTRELLRQDWPETVDRLAAILTGQNTAAKMAVALALTDLPEFLSPTYVDPLMALLDDADAEVRWAAAAALAGYRDSGVTPRLRGTMLDQSQPLSRRLAAIEALGMMTKRPAVAALVEALADPDAPICEPALRALERATAMNFRDVGRRGATLRDDVAGARAWWEQSRDLPLPRWQQDQIDRLVQKSREMRRRLREFEGRLVEAFRDHYSRTPEAERGALLQGYLADGSTRVRLFGLDLVQRHLGEGKPLSPEIAAELRAMLTDADPEVRTAAVQNVARLRDAVDTDRLLELLDHERHVMVRRALVNGLGYVGTGTVAEPLLALLRTGNDPCLTEVVAALGRLAERGVLVEQQRGAVADALLATFGDTQPSQAALRERVLWAMSLVVDPRFAPAFEAALTESEATAVRQAGLRGIAALKNPRLADTIVPLVREGDPALRRSAVEALAGLASREEHLAALWARSDPAQEPDESIRRAAWDGAVRLVSDRAVVDVDWVVRLPRDGPERAGRALELLVAMEASLADAADARGKLGRIRARIAAERAVSGEVDEAVAAYLAALGDLHAAASAEIPPVALELLRLALAHGRYNEAVAAALAGGNPPLDGAALWKGIKPDIEKRLTPEQADQAIAMLEALQARPPTVFPQEVTAAIEELLGRAQALRKPPPSTAPASQPASAPTSQPVASPG